MSDLQAIEIKLEKAKAYKTLLSHKFFKKDTEITKLVEAELVAFIQSQLGKIFGMGKQQTSLSEEDVGILKLVANKLISKTEDTEPEEAEEEPEQVQDTTAEVDEEPAPPPKQEAKPVKKLAKTKLKSEPISETPVFAWQKKIVKNQPGMTKNFDYAKLGLQNDVFEKQEGDSIVVDRQKNKILIFIGKFDNNIKRYEEKLLKHASQGSFSTNETSYGMVNAVATSATKSSDMSAMGDLSSLMSYHVNSK